MGVPRLAQLRPGCKRIDITRIEGSGGVRATDTLVVEHRLSIRLGGRPAGDVWCTPEDLEDLVAGYLLGEGHLGGPAGSPGASRPTGSPEHVFRCILDSASPGVTGAEVEAGHALDGELAGPVYDRARSLSSPRVRPADLTLLADTLQEAELFRLTGAAHSALAAEPGTGSFDPPHVVVLREDVSRHNAIDKVIGHLWLTQGLPGPPILAVSCRISSDLAHRVAQAGFKILVSRGAPTTRAVEVADGYALTLIGFARDGRMNAYTGGERLLLEG